MGIDFKVNFTSKIKINGKEYGSAEEVPEQYRETVKNAMSQATATGGRRKITVNGVGYDSVEAMPPDTRRVYEEALAKAKAAAEQTDTLLPEPPSADIKPEGLLSARNIIIFALLAAFAIMLKLLAH